MTLEFQATPEEVMRAVEALRDFGRAHQVSERPLHALALALEECSSNIVNHALRRDPQQKFRVSLELTGRTLTVELRDRGPAFDPTQVPVRRPPPQDEDPDTGGWGIPLIRQFTDEIRYAREDGENILRLVKYLGPAA